MKGFNQVDGPFQSMSKSKTFREKDNERVHGKISYRKRVLEEQEAKSLIEEVRNNKMKCQNEQCYCTGACKVDY